MEHQEYFCPTEGAISSTCLCRRFAVRHKLSPADQRTHRTIQQDAMRCTCEIHWTQDWDQFIDPVLFAYRTLKHTTTKMEPFFLLYGRQATLPFEFSLPTFATRRAGGDPAIGITPAGPRGKHPTTT